MIHEPATKSLLGVLTFVIITRLPLEIMIVLAIARRFPNFFSNVYYTGRHPGCERPSRQFSRRLARQYKARAIRDIHGYYL